MENETGEQLRNLEKYHVPVYSKIIIAMLQVGNIVLIRSWFDLNILFSLASQ